MKQRAHKEYTDIINATKTKDFNYLLTKAWEVRNFEIELYWKRTTYFSILVGAIFIGYYNASSSFLKLLICCIGYFSSFIWYLASKGSKFWQENWEAHIDCLENLSKKNNIYQIVLGRDKCFSDAFSVSKLNQYLIKLIIISWAILLISTVCNICSDTCHLKNCYSAIIAIILIIIIGISYHIYSYCQTSFKKELKKIKSLKNYDEFYYFKR